MIRKFQIVVVALFVLLLLFVLFNNIVTTSDEEREVPSKEEIDEFNNVQSKSDANTYEVKDIPNKELATIYYNHFKDLVVNDSSEAYSRVRNKDVVSEDDFNTFRNNIINNYYNNKVSSYNIGGSIYRIENSDGDIITFYVDAVFMYEVELEL